jgi:hypothetical protein
MNGMEWRQVPVGLDAQRWVTRTGCKNVLVVVHTVTTAQRIAHAVRLIESDRRVQVIYTAAPDVFGNGVAGLLRRLDALVVPWEQAKNLTFDLALAAAYGSIHELHAPLIVLPHGAGYNKLAVPSTVNGATAARGVYGLDQQSLLQGGKVVATAVVLSHDADMTVLGRQCPDALPVAEVAGDPCYDQMLASCERRAVYRRALGVSGSARLVVTASTWGQRSLFGQAADLHDRLLAELPADRYRVAALLHPNVWYGHGPRQVRAWLGGALRRGLAVVPPSSEWLGALIAADVVVADHGSTGVYGAAAGIPVILATFPDGDVAAGSAGALLAGAAPRLCLRQPLARQLDEAALGDQAALSARVSARLSSEPGRFGRNMRRLMYQILGLPQPPTIPAMPPADIPTLIQRGD